MHRYASPFRIPGVRSCSAGLIVLLALAGPAAGAAAQTRGPQALPPAAPQVQPATPYPTAPAVQYDSATQFDSTERWLIPRYFELLRGKQKRAARSKVYIRDLPDGMTQPAQIGDVLPPAVIAGLPGLPGPLLRDLPPRRPDTQRYVAGKDVLLVQLSSGKVLDILQKILY